MFNGLLNTSASLLAVATLLAPVHVAAQVAAAAQTALAVPPNRFITLGTHGGPLSNPTRSQPANVLIIGRDAYVVDIGDGGVQQMAKAGVILPQVKGVFLSHLHFDHTGGLAALLGLRLQLRIKGKLPIYGPPGTKELVAGLVSSMKPAAAAGYGIAGEGYDDPTGTAEVFEVGDGQAITVGPMTVKVRQNTHYDYPAGSDMDKRFKSVAYRFDLADRSIVYTGDTGPSKAVEELAKGADLLVSEMIDEEAVVGAVRRSNPQGSAQMRNVVQHLTTHHLTSAEVGKLAKTAGVKSVVITHLAGDNPTGADFMRYLKGINAVYSGPVIIATDLDQY